MSEDASYAKPHPPQSRVHRHGAGAGGSLGSLVDLDATWGHRHSGRVGGGAGHRCRDGPIRVVCLELRGGGTWYARPVGRTVARCRGRALPLGAQPDLHRRAPDCPGGGVAIHARTTASIRRHDGVFFHLFITGKNGRCAAASAVPTWSTGAWSRAGFPARRAAARTDKPFAFRSRNVVPQSTRERPIQVQKQPERLEPNSQVTSRIRQ